MRFVVIGLVVSLRSDRQTFVVVGSFIYCICGKKYRDFLVSLSLVFMHFGRWTLRLMEIYFDRKYSTECINDITFITLCCA